MAEEPERPAPFALAELRYLQRAAGAAQRDEEWVDELLDKLHDHIRYLHLYRPPGNAASTADALDKHADDLLAPFGKDVSPFAQVALTLESVRHVARLLRAAAVLLRSPHNSIDDPTKEA